MLWSCFPLDTPKIVLHPFHLRLLPLEIFSSENSLCEATYYPLEKFRRWSGLFLAFTPVPDGFPTPNSLGCAWLAQALGEFVPYPGFVVPGIDRRLRHICTSFRESNSMRVDVPPPVAFSMLIAVLARAQRYLFQIILFFHQSRSPPFGCQPFYFPPGM